jgi:hypothetical protein
LRVSGAGRRVRRQPYYRTHVRRDGDEDGGAAVDAAEVAHRGLAEAPTEWLEREIGELATDIAAAMCRWLELVAEFDRREAHTACENGNLHWPQSGGLIWPHPVTVDVSV